jgi:16S rRNA G966 N2-methylase RsmD
MPALKFSTLTQHEKYDLIFADPPFFKDDIHETAKNILKNGFLEEEGLFIIERSIQTEEKDIEAFQSKPIKRMGDSLIYQITL